MTVSKRETKAEQREKFERKQAQVGLASNIVGLTAGVAATAAAARNPALRQKGVTNRFPGSNKVAPGGPVTGRLAQRLKSPVGRARLIRAGAAGALGLQVLNTAGDVVANRVLSREAKVEKSSRDKWKSDQKKIKAKVHGKVAADLERQKKHEQAEHKMAIDQAWMGVKHANLRRDLEMPLATAGSKPVAKSEQSLISKSEEVPGRGSGVGQNLLSKRMGPVSDEEWEKGRKKDKRAHGAAGAISGGVLGAGLGAIGGAAWHDSDARKYNDAVFDNDLERRYAQSGKRPPNFKPLPKRPRAGLRVGGAAAAGALVGGGLLALGSRKAVDHAYNQPENRRNVNRLRMMVDAADDELETYSARTKAKRLKAEQKAAKLEKRDRNFDSESDRQRRLGLFTGAAAGGSALLGVNAARGTRIIRATDEEGMKALTAKPPRPLPKGSQRGIAILAPGNGLKRRIASGAGSAGLAALALAAYKHGQSENNRPWS